MTKAMVTIVPAVTGELTMFRNKANRLRRHRAVALIQAVLYAVSRDTVARGAISARLTATRAGVSAITAVRRIWLAGLEKPPAHRA